MYHEHQMQQMIAKLKQLERVTICEAGMKLLAPKIVTLLP